MGIYLIQRKPSVQWSFLSNNYADPSAQGLSTSQFNNKVGLLAYVFNQTST